MDNLGVVFLSELVGTFMLVLLGCGVVANVALAKNKGFGGGFLMVNFGWGLAVFAGVTVAYASGAHLNPAVTLGLVANGATEFGQSVPVDVVSVVTYIGAQLVGAFLGAVGAWLAYKQHFDAEPEAATKLGVFSTGPAIRSYGWNLVTEIFGTFVLVFVVIGPVSDFLAGALGDGIGWVFSTVPWLGGAIVGGLWQVFVIFGLHWGLVPLFQLELQNTGQMLLIGPVLAAVLAQAAAVAGVLVRTRNKNLRSLAAPATLSGLLAGITHDLEAVLPSCLHRCRIGEERLGVGLRLGLLAQPQKLAEGDGQGRPAV